ncbi:hypothetical protein Moror_213 [Moniliophthora roreri MCA 2997]|uniref:Uncharacterized protein n=1 Tax=Moniliophthora roreri (strain MCA 2997) TaxID=1381753 RepID=V2XGX8_MONRO|nr:hypothetical protein Moror_213 [Moniliophthora roreri MCA 2997]
MFCCCSDTDKSMDLHENATTTGALLALIHRPPSQPVISHQSDPANGLLPKVIHDPATVIPLPILPSLFALADKYSLSETITQSLREHLLAHAPNDPLRVYGLAVSFNLTSIASKASQYLQPLASYSSHQIKAIPTVDAYHRVAQLQDFRVKSLRQILLEEDIFPHGYGSCASHREATISVWQEMRMTLALKVDTLTDVAGEMESIANLPPVKDCSACRKACIAAVDMLRYKCRKVPRETERLSLGHS